MTLVQDPVRPRIDRVPAGPPGPRAEAGRTPRWAAAAELARQWALIGLAVLLYFGVRGLTQGEVEVAVDHGLDVLRFEQRLGLDIERGAQGLVVDHHGLVTAANWVYIWGHWPVITVTLVWLFRSRRWDYLLLRNAMFLSGAIGLVIFARYAVAPPRLLGVGFVDTVTDHSNSYRVLQPPSLVNKYAAVPSLHVGWNLLVGVALWQATRHRGLRLLAVVGPVLMTVAVVVTGNHYVVDAVLGAGVALVGLAASHQVTPRLAALGPGLRARGSWTGPGAGARPSPRNR